MEPIIFGKKRGFKVKDKEWRTQILHSLREFSSVRLWEDGGYQLTNWSHEVFKKLKHHPHLARLIPEKRPTKGIGRIEEPKSFTAYPCKTYFFLITTIKGKNICCFIEKKVPLDTTTIIQTRFRFRDHLFSGTLFTGSLSPSSEICQADRVDMVSVFSQYFPDINREITSTKKGNWVFLLDDLWAVGGKEVSCALPQRLVMCQDLMAKHWYPDTRIDVCKFDLVYYTPYSTLEKTLRYDRKELYYNTNDHKVIFVPAQGAPGMYLSEISITESLPNETDNDTAVFRNGQWGFQETGSGRMLEKKGKIEQVRKKSVLELKLSDFPDVYWVIHPRTGNNLGAALVRSLEESRVLKSLFIDNKESVMLPCVFEEEFMKWRPELETEDEDSVEELSFIQDL